VPSTETRTCRNCGATLLGPFCPACGQEDVDLHRPLQQLAQDAVGDLLNLDTRLLRTLGPLLLRPGHLTREYLAGRRVRYVPPLKLFLLASVLFFGLVALLPRARVTVTRMGETAPQIPGGGPRINIAVPKVREERTWIDHRINEASRKVKEHPEAFVDAGVANLPRAFFLLLPIFALLLKLFYRRQGWYYLDHLIFALHHHAFGFTALTLLVILGRPWVPDRPGFLAALAVWLWFFAYLPLALRRVYGGTRWKTFLKFTGLATLYFVAFLFTLWLLLLVTLWWF
jgi:Protein of unknown function (DUF3667)